MSFNAMIEDNEKKGDVDTQMRLWQLILKTADEMYGDSKVYWILDGYAIAGAKLKVGNKGFRMERGSYWTEKEWEKDRSEFLLPHKNQIKYIFKNAYQKFI